MCNDIVQNNAIQITGAQDITRHITTMELVKVTESKRGYAVLLTGGDKDISSALGNGIINGLALIPAKSEPPETAIIRKRTAETLRRIDMRCRPKEADDDDIETRILKAQAAYGTNIRPSILRAIGGKLLGLYGLAVLKAHDFFDFDNTRWRG